MGFWIDCPPTGRRRYASGGARTIWPQSIRSGLTERSSCAAGIVPHSGGETLLRLTPAEVLNCKILCAMECTPYPYGAGLAELSSSTEKGFAARCARKSRTPVWERPAYRDKATISTARRRPSIGSLLKVKRGATGGRITACCSAGYGDFGRRTVALS
jgi:hypothetical protein